MLGAGTIAIAAVGFWALQPKPASPVAQQVTPTKAPVATVAVVNRGLPIRLKAPRLGVDAAVAYMGLTKAGDMDTPVSINDVGWYKYGPLPGNTGSAVMSGHIDGPRGEPAVFSKLGKLQAGDQLVVVDSTGQSTTFAVRETRTYKENDQPAEVFTSTEGAHLNLITCTGSWDAGRRQFSERLVVFSDKTD